MKKVLHMHSNIFDSTHQREIKSTDNVFGKFLTKEGLYDEIEITEDNIFEVSPIQRPPQSAFGIYSYCNKERDNTG